MSKQQVAGRKKVVKAPGQSPVKKAPQSSEPKGLNSMSNWLILLVLVMPITYSTDVMDAALVPRYILLSGFLFLFTTYFFFFRKRGINLSADKLLTMIFGVAAAYGLWCIVSLFFAINPVEGYYEVSRTFLSIILLFSIVTALREEGSATLKLCKVLALMAVIQSFVGILQYYDLGFTYLPGNYKPYGLMANRNLFGSGQMYLLPFVLYVLYQGNRTWRYISGLALIGLVASIILSQTRSAWLGTGVMFTFSVIMVSIYVPAHRKKLLIGASLTLAGIALLTSVILLTDQEGTLRESVKERAASLAKPLESASGSSSTAKDRVAIWRQTTKMIQEYPVLGVGVANWRVGILKYGTDGTSWHTGVYIPDRPHNVYLQIASETGLPGLILYTAMWILIAVVGFRVIIRTQVLSERIVIILMLAGITSFAVDSLFSFPTERIEHTLYVLMMAGIILGYHSQSISQKTQLKKGLQKGLGIAMLAVITINLVISFTKQSFEKHAALAHYYLYTSPNMLKVIEETEAGKSWLLKLNPNGRPLELYSAEAYRQLKQFDKAIEEVNQARVYNPYSAKILNTLGTIFTDMEQFDKAIPVYEQAMSITPNDPVVLQNLAVNYFQVKKYKECLQMLKKLNVSSDPYLVQLYNAAIYRSTATGKKAP